MTGSGSAAAVAAVGPVSAPSVAALPQGAALPATTSADLWTGLRSCIAHRGSGDVAPENSIPAFQHALDHGAMAMEISVRRTSDGRLVVLHDEYVDRTTTGAGAVAALTFGQVRAFALRTPQGPAFGTSLRVPSLEEVLDLVGGRAVLAIEAKDDKAYDGIVALVKARGLASSCLIKVHFANKRRIAAAQVAGFGVFAYFGSPEEMTAAAITTLGTVLRGGRDFLVLWAYGPGGALLDPALVRTALATGHQVWAAVIHRRHEADQLRAWGVTGLVTANFGYVSRTAAVQTQDSWKTRKFAIGELPALPQGPTPSWVGTEEWHFDKPKQQFVTLGNLSPVRAASGTYRVDFDVKWVTLPGDRTGHVDLVFGESDDRAYQHQLGLSDGYHVVLRPDGRVQLYAHLAGKTAGQLLATATDSTVPAGEWRHYRLEVTAVGLSLARTGGATAVNTTSTDTRFRGGYLALGRTTSDGVAAVRRLVVS